MVNPVFTFCANFRQGLIHERDVSVHLDAEDEGGAGDAAAALREDVHDAAQRRHEARQHQADRHRGVRVAAGHLVEKVRENLNEVPRKANVSDPSMSHRAYSGVISGSGGNYLFVFGRVGEDTFKKYLKIQILYTETYIYTNRQ